MCKLLTIRKHIVIIFAEGGAFVPETVINFSCQDTQKPTGGKQVPLRYNKHFTVSALVMIPTVKSSGEDLSGV